MFDPQIAGCESGNNNALYHPWVKHVLQQIRLLQVAKFVAEISE